MAQCYVACPFVCISRVEIVKPGSKAGTEEVIEAGGNSQDDDKAGQPCIGVCHKLRHNRRHNDIDRIVDDLGCNQYSLAVFKTPQKLWGENT